MNDPIPLHIATAFLLVQLGVWFSAAWNELGFDRQSIAVDPLRFLMAAGLTLICISFAFFMLGIQYVALAIVIGLSVPICLMHPLPAVCVLISFLVLRPWELGMENSFLNILPRFIAGLAMLSWLWHALRTSSLRFIWNDTLTLLFLFLAWLLISALVRGDLEAAERLFLGFLPMVVLFLLIVNIPTNRKAFNRLLTCLVLSVTGVMAIALYVTLTDEVVLKNDSRLYGLGVMGNANDLAACIVLILPTLFFFQKRSKKSVLVNPVFLLVSGILLAALWYSQSRGAIVALAVTLVAYLLFDMRSWKGALVTIVLAAALPALIFLGIARSEGDLAISQESRMGYLIAGLRMFRSNPFFGVGVYNYPKVYDQFAVVFYEAGEQTAHSSWVLPLAEAGFFGFLFFTLLYLSALVRGFRIRKSRPEFFYALVAYGVAISFLSHTYLLFPYLLVALCTCASRLWLEQEAL